VSWTFAIGLTGRLPRCSTIGRRVVLRRQPGEALGVDPEEALRAGNRKFAARFPGGGRAMKERGKSVAQGTAEELANFGGGPKKTVP